MPITLRRDWYLVISHRARVSLAELVDCLPLTSKSDHVVTLIENESHLVILECFIFLLHHFLHETM